MTEAYKVTTNGRSVLAACIHTGQALEITGAAVGSGKISEDADLADQHQLVRYVADASIGNRRHYNEQLGLDIQYSNFSHPEVKTFYLQEWIIYAKHPDTGNIVDIAYGTLGDYPQPVPQYSTDTAPVTYNFPVTLILSDGVGVTISAPAGVVTYDELVELVRQTDVVIPRTGWTADEDTDGFYPLHCDIADDKIRARMVPQLTILPDSARTAINCELSTYVQAINGALRVYAGSVPAAPIHASLLLLSNPPYVHGYVSGGDSDGDSVQAGVGLSMTNGRLNVNLGRGVSVDNLNNVQVDQQTVITDNDMLDEDDTEESLRDILLS